MTTRDDGQRSTNRGGTAACVSYCECYGDPEDAPLCDECKAEERERDAERAADLFEEDVKLYGI